MRPAVAAGDRAEAPVGAARVREVEHGEELDRRLAVGVRLVPVPGVLVPAEARRRRRLRDDVAAEPPRVAEAGARGALPWRTEAPGSHGAAGASEPLVALLSTEAAAVAATAIQTLVTNGIDVAPAIVPLQRLLADGDDRARCAAGSALTALGASKVRLESLEDVESRFFRIVTPS